MTRMTLRDHRSQRFWAASVLLLLLFKFAFAAPLACCIDSDPSHARHQAPADDADALEACALHQCCVITAGLNANPAPQPVMVLLVAEFVSTEQLPWGDARIIASYLSRGPPLTLS
ncbi:MAG: hypothetical protein KJP03_05160 [Gammaproteobacteria bacterium]|nr:hypothetical protein [Gammaproteobacteria bacterium]